MRSNINLLLLLCVITVATHAQELLPPTLKLGDQAPPLRLQGWLKGTPVERLEKGRLYVVEFWATWCAPCRLVMPHLSALARKYRDTLTVLSIDILEQKTTSFEKVKAFVDSMGDRMDYAVAAEQGYLMQTGWYYAAEAGGIPSCFIINAEGKIAWIGHPMMLEEVLPKILNNTWDIKAALEERNRLRRLAKLDGEVYYELIRFRNDPYDPDSFRDPDSVLLTLKAIVQKEPDLKYAPTIAFHTFASLLKTDPQKAYNYGKEVLVTPTCFGIAWTQIRAVVKLYADKLNLPAEIYQLGAEAYQLEIDHVVFPEYVDMYKYYNDMASFYWRANDTLKAIDVQQKAIADMKSRKKYSSATLAEYEAKLQHYKSK